MEAYPGELLVGVCPLVFCVDATWTKSQEGKDDDDGTAVTATTTDDAATSTAGRSQFDRFLDAMASSLLEDDDPDEGVVRKQNRKNSNIHNHGSSTSNSLLLSPGGMSLFRGDTFDSYDSEDDDDYILHRQNANSINSANNANLSFDGGSGFADPRRTPRSFAFGGLRGNKQNSKSNPLPKNASSSLLLLNSSSLINTSFAKKLQEGQNFFQRARIVSAGVRHGFPPSKDPSGEQNRISHYLERNRSSSNQNSNSNNNSGDSLNNNSRDNNNMSSSSERQLQFYQQTVLSPSKIVKATQQHPIDGILPSGWLEKHAHALPSVILVVLQVLQNDVQPTQDGLLLQTLESLQHSLATKRDCTIHIVGLVQEGVSPILAEQWSQTVVAKLKSDEYQGGLPLTLLKVADLGEDYPPLPLRRLHKSVRDASLHYYSNQARRSKQKIIQLGLASNSPMLLPLTIRYCFKVAMFFEFQWKQERSLKFLVDAYRHVETYYRYLLQQRELAVASGGDDDKGANNNDNEHDAEQDDALPISVAHNNDPSNPQADDSEAGGVELSLHNNFSSGDQDKNDHVLLWKHTTPPEDMVHQCRAVADWLNFKILQAGCMSHTEGGLLAASTQWQKHAQVFCNPRKSFVCPPFHKWMDWSYVAHQRVVVSQLLERHPPKALGDLGQAEFDEVLLRCSPWRTYEAAAEALLQLGAHLQQAAEQVLDDQNSSTPVVDEMRNRYVGGLYNEGYAPKLQEELKINHREKALDCIFRAVSLFERDVEKAKKDELQVTPWNRSGARIYYMAGNTLLSLGRHDEATPHLEKAAKLAKGWSGLELVIRRRLIECYEMHIPSETDNDESSQTLASMLLDSYFNAEMSHSDLRRALEKFSALSGGGTIQWYRNCMNEADSALPFSFAVTFPSATHATAGDGVKASVLIKSNLDYAVHVNSVTLLSLAGQISIPSTDLLSAKNANEGSGGGIIMQANAEILLSTQIKLPENLDQIAVDETGNGGEKEGVAGKGSFAKSARPRTGGITSGAGGRLISEELFRDEEKQTGSGQWSLRCLGGKPLRCDGLRLVFYPVYSAAISEGKNTEVELTIEKKQSKTEAKIKRTPFEEENYLASAWMRPRHLPMNRGPRCLRVLPHMADMIVTNLTEPCTNGKVLEGTVNGIILRLKAGPYENCTDVKFRVTCSSLLVSAEGITKRISAEDGDDPDMNPVVDIKNPNARTPVLVRRDENAKSQMTEFGYEIPAGWSLLGDGQGALDEHSPVVSTLKSGESTYAHFEVFRPSPQITRMDGVVQLGDDAQNLALEREMCQTDIDVSICYRQERPAQKMKQIPARRRQRKKPGEESETTPPSVNNDAGMVHLNHSSAVIWSAPISALFSPGLKDTHPSGNRHPSNTLPDPSSKTRSLPSAQSEMVLIDGERVTTKCTLEGAASADGLMTDIEQICFEDNNDKHAPCSFNLLSGKDDEGLLYKSVLEDPCRKLVLGSKFALAWTSEVNMKSNYLKGSVSSFMGVISVDWLPTTLNLPDEVTVGELSAPITSHGPLRLETPSICRFMGPPCYIENAPFETEMERMTSPLQVAVPFDVTYHIKNKTSIDQTLKVILKDAEPGNDESHGFLVAGLINGEVSLGPFEKHTLSYTALATRAGKIWMPQVSVSSDRYNTFIIQESHRPRRSLFIQP